MQRVLAQVGVALVVLTTIGAAHGPNTSENQIQTGKKQPVQTARAYPPFNRKAKPYEVGPASWYGKFFNGKPTASGEAYNMYEMTAAHPDLPLGTRVRVTDMRNGRSVIVRVNDRGPLVPGRIIDLSYGAAKALGFTEKGVQRVRLDIVPADRTTEMENARLR